MLLPAGIWSEFANTYTEWHYFVSGISVGFVFGWLSLAVLHRLTEI